MISFRLFIAWSHTITCDTPVDALRLSLLVFVLFTTLLWSGIQISASDRSWFPAVIGAALWGMSAMYVIWTGLALLFGF